MYYSIDIHVSWQVLGENVTSLIANGMRIRFMILVELKQYDRKFGVQMDAYSKWIVVYINVESTVIAI